MMLTAKKLTTIAYVLFFMVIVLLITLPVSASSATIELSSSSANVQKNSNFVVTATINTSGQVSDALVRVNFDSSKVSYVSASFAGSPLTEDFGSKANSNHYVADRYKLGTPFPSGSIVLVKLTFKALASSGSTTFVVDTGTTEIGDANNPSSPHSPVTASNTSVNFAAAPENSSQSQTGQNTTNNGDSKPAPAGAPTEQEQLVNSELDNEEPVPATEYVDETSYEVEILVLDNENNPEPGIEVKLGDLTSITNEDGIANFTGVKSGNYSVSAKGTSQEILVSTGDPYVVQNFTLVLGKGLAWVTYVIIAVFTLLIIAGAGYLVYWFRNKRGSSNSMHGSVDSMQSPNDEAQTKREEYLKPDPPSPETIIKPEDKE